MQAMYYRDTKFRIPCNSIRYPARTESPHSAPDSPSQIPNHLASPQHQSRQPPAPSTNTNKARVLSALQPRGVRSNTSARQLSSSGATTTRTRGTVEQPRSLSPLTHLTYRPYTHDTLPRDRDRTIGEARRAREEALPGKLPARSSLGPAAAAAAALQLLRV